MAGGISNLIPPTSSTAVIIILYYYFKTKNNYNIYYVYIICYARTSVVPSCRRVGGTVGRARTVHVSVRTTIKIYTKETQQKKKTQTKNKCHPLLTLFNVGNNRTKRARKCVLCFLSSKSKVIVRTCMTTCGFSPAQKTFSRHRAGRPRRWRPDAGARINKVGYKRVKMSS